MPSSLRVSELASELQQHIADNPAIFSQEFSMMEFDTHMRLYENVQDKQPLYELDITDPAQPGNRASYAPKNNVLDWKNRTLEVKNGEVTLKLGQNEIEALWKTHLAKLASEERRGNVYEVPFEQYMMNRLIARLKDQIVKKLMWKGALNASGTTSADICDGFETILAAAITAGEVPAGNVFTGASITNSNALAQFEGVVNLLATQNPELLNTDLVFYCSPENAKKYWENYRATHGALPYNQAFQKRIVNDMSNIELIPQDGLSGDDRLVLTPRYNLAVGSDALERLDNIVVEYRERAIHVLIDFKIGFNFALGDYVFSNDL